MKVILVILIFISILNFNSIPRTEIYAGVYGYGSNLKKGATGRLLINPESDSTILFYLKLNRGGPSFNSGETYGRIKLKDKSSGVYSRIDTTWGYNCVLSFYFKEDKVVIEPLNEKCGYGWKVYPGGEFKRKSSKIPDGFTDYSNNRVLFSSESLEKWNAD